MAQTHARCLTDAGLPAEVLNGGVHTSIPEGQEEAYAIGAYVCAVMYPLDPRFLVPPDDEQLAVLYYYFIEEQIPCLEQHGYDVGPAPSLQLFMEKLKSDSDVWTPYGVIGPTVPAADLPDLEAACPQLPHDYYD